jgi:hypothetical protein
VARKVLYFIILALAIIALGVLYYRFGGFNKILVQKIESSASYTIKISGKPFKGRIQDTAWKNLFYEMHDNILKSRLKEPITIIYFSKPEEHRGKIDAFIGAEVLENSSLPKDFIEQELAFKGVLRVDLNMHPVILPSPARVKKLIMSYAKDKNISLDSLLIEKYHPDNSLTVEVPFR